MPHPSKQKVRIHRRKGDSSPHPAERERLRPTSASKQWGYFDIHPAALPPRLDGLKALTKAGVRGFPEVDDAQALLAHTLRKQRVQGDVLDLSAMGGLLGSLPGVKLRAVEGSAAALCVLRSGGFNVVAAAPGDPLTSHWPDRARTVALVLAGDRGNAYALSQVAWAHANTPPGGTLYLAGDRDKGFDRYVRAAGEAFGTGEVIARDGGMRVAKLTRRPGPTPPYPVADEFEVFGVKVVGLPGVFSAARPDRATALLLEHLADLNLAGKRVLDLGCGTGLIGAWAAQRGAQVMLLDADLQSVRSAQATLSANALTGEILHSDVDAALTDQTFDVILTNPPFHVGRGVVLDVALEFIAAAQRRLRPGGSFYLVANDPLPYEAAMQAIGPVNEVLRRDGFKILQVN